MARYKRNKEGLVLLLDVGPSMHSFIPEIEKLCSLLFIKKLIYGKFDEVGIVLFGTHDTRNSLTKEVGGYEHVVVLRNMKVVDGDHAKAIEHLPRGTVNGDYFDAIVVGMDMLIKKYRSTNKRKMRLCLITNAIYPIRDPYEGTKEDQVRTVAEQMTARGMRMENIIIRGRLSSTADQIITDENDHLLNIFSNKTSARTVYIQSPTSLLGALRTRNISPVTIFRGDLEISPKMKIKVWVYKKTLEDKFPILKRYSDKVPPTDKFATHEVKVDYEYKTVDNPTKIVPPEQRIKGYRYGPQVVPISSAEWDAVNFKSKKGVKLLGFTDNSNIFRRYYMKDVNIFIAEPHNTRATLAVSALARAMKEMNKVAILHCVWRQGQGNVAVGVLTPNVSEKGNIPDSFYFNVLPFAEDVHEFQFPSFTNFPSSWLPNEQQQEAADNLVKMLDLAPSEEEETLLPDFTPNLALERFHCYLELKSKQPEATVPPLDETLKKITEPASELLSENQSIFDAMLQHFEVKENPKMKKSPRRLLREKPSGSDREEEHGNASNIQSVMSTENKPQVKVEKIGDSTPVQDFEAVMLRRDNPNWVGKAIKDMQNEIHNLLEKSHKVLECMVALRKHCIIEQEPKQFNDFLRRLFKFSQENNLSRFCEVLSSKEFTLISKSEAENSDVTDDEARSFLVKNEP